MYFLKSVKKVKRQTFFVIATFLLFCLPFKCCHQALYLQLILFHCLVASWDAKKIATRENLVRLYGVAPKTKF